MKLVPPLFAIGLAVGAVVRLGGEVLDVSGIELGFLYWLSLVALILVIVATLIVKIRYREAGKKDPVRAILLFSVGFAGAYILVGVTVSLLAVGNLAPSPAIWLLMLAIYATVALGITGALWALREPPRA